VARSHLPEAPTPLTPDSKYAKEHSAEAPKKPAKNSAVEKTAIRRMLAG